MEEQVRALPAPNMNGAAVGHFPGIVVRGPLPLPMPSPRRTGLAERMHPVSIAEVRPAGLGVWRFWWARRAVFGIAERMPRPILHVHPVVGILRKARSVSDPVC